MCPAFCPKKSRTSQSHRETPQQLQNIQKAGQPKNSKTIQTTITNLQNMLEDLLNCIKKPKHDFKEIQCQQHSMKSKRQKFQQQLEHTSIPRRPSRTVFLCGYVWWESVRLQTTHFQLKVCYNVAGFCCWGVDSVVGVFARRLRKRHSHQQHETAPRRKE